ncbi:MAG: hypothetical protein RR357_01610 [Clostridia bacterium]
MKHISKITNIILLCLIMCFSFVGCNTDRLKEIQNGIIDTIKDAIARAYSVSLGGNVSSILLSKTNGFIYTKNISNGTENRVCNITGKFVENESGLYLTYDKIENISYKFGFKNSNTTLGEFNTQVIKRAGYIVFNGDIMFSDEKTFKANEIVTSIGKRKLEKGGEYDFIVKKGATIEDIVSDNKNCIVELMGDGNSLEYPLLAEMLASLDTSKEGKQIIDITYKNSTAKKFSFLVSSTFGSFDISELQKQSMPVGSTVDEFICGKTIGGNPLTRDMIADFDSSKEGKKNITVAFNGIIVKVQVYFYNAENFDKVWNFKVELNNVDKDCIESGVELSGKLCDITQMNGQKLGDVLINEKIISGYDKTKIGAQKVVFSYGGQTKTKILNVYDNSTKPIVDVKLIACGSDTQSPIFNITSDGATNIGDFKVRVSRASSVFKDVAVGVNMFVGLNVSTAYNGQTIYIKYNVDGYNYYLPLTIKLICDK